MRFGYYDGLTAKQKRTYRKSDAITQVALAPSATLQAAVNELSVALAGKKRVVVERAASNLCDCITRSLAVPSVNVRVLSRRPKSHDGELHGLYTWEDGKRAQIEVWMRTAERRDVVAFRTFLRTLVHEVCHHLDFVLFNLEDTFHTQGFFRRESSLVRVLSPPARAKQAPNLPSQPVHRAAVPRKSKTQLSLFE